MVLMPIQITRATVEIGEISALSVEKPEDCDYELGVKDNEPLFYNANVTNFVNPDYSGEMQLRLVVTEIVERNLPNMTYSGYFPPEPSEPLNASYEINVNTDKWVTDTLKWVRITKLEDGFEIPVAGAYEKNTNIVMCLRGGFPFPLIIPKNHMSLINDTFTFYNLTINYIDTYNMSVKADESYITLNYTTDGILRKLLMNEYQGETYKQKVDIKLIKSADLNGNSVPSGNIIATTNGREVTFQYNKSEIEIDVGEAIKCSWNFGDQIMATLSATDITHKYKAYGNYIVTLTVTDQSDDVGVFTYELKLSMPVTTVVLIVIGVGAVASGIGFFVYRRFIRPKPRYDKATQTYSCRQGFVYQDNKCVKISSTAGTVTVSRIRKK
jgi:hypothetical protein